jgi:hypothetical protein
MKNKTRFKILICMIMGFVLLIATGCDEWENAAEQQALERERTDTKVSTDFIDNVSPNSATCYGTLISSSLKVADLGFYWSKSENPNSDGNIATTAYNDNGIGQYSVELKGLSPKTKYYVQAFAKNFQAYTGFGQVLSFTTK